MTHQDQFERIKEAITEGRTVKDGAIASVIVNYTKDDNDAVADQNAEKWAQNMLQEWSKAPNDPVHVNIATETMFNHLRLAVKRGKIIDLKVSVDGKIYDIVFPNGKLFGIAAPDCFNANQDVMMNLL